MVYVLPCRNFNSRGDIFYDRIKLCFDTTAGANPAMGSKKILYMHAFCFVICPIIKN